MTNRRRPNETVRFIKPGRHPIVTGIGLGCGIIVGLFIGVQVCALIYLLAWNQP